MPHDPILRVVQVFVILAMGLLAIPISALIYTALAGESGFTLGNLFRVTRFPQFWPAMGNTLISGVGTVCTMMLLAVPLTWLYTRTDLPRKSLLIALVTINVAIPSFLVALGYIFIFNPSNGVFNVAWRSLAGTTEAPVNIYSLGWIFFLQGIALSSPAFFMMVPTFQGIDTALEEAASANGVRRWKATLFIVLPLAAPVILAVSAYYFIIAIEMFDYAGMLGLPVQVYVASGLLFTLINDARALPRYPEAASLGLIMATVAMFLAIIYLWAVRKADRYVTLTGKPRAQVSIKLSRRGKTLSWGFIFVYFLIGTAIPLAMLVWASGIPFLKVPTWDNLGDWSFRAYWTVLPYVPDILANNIIFFLAVPTGAVILGACLAWVGTRYKGWFPKSVSLLVMIAVGVPSIVGAVGFLIFGLGVNAYVPIYGTIWLIAIAMVARHLTWANRTVSGAMMQIHPEIEEAATVSGVRKGRRFFSILLPNVSRALFVSWFWLGLLTLRELTIPVMLQRPGTEVFATTIWDLNASGLSDEAAALSVILALLILGLVLVFHFISTRWATRR